MVTERGRFVRANRIYPEHADEASALHLAEDVGLPGRILSLACPGISMV